jgi:hypothetical protein
MKTMRIIILYFDRNNRDDGHDVALCAYFIIVGEW